MYGEINPINLEVYKHEKEWKLLNEFKSKKKLKNIIIYNRKQFLCDSLQVNSYLKEHMWEEIHDPFNFLNESDRKTSNEVEEQKTIIEEKEFNTVEKDKYSENTKLSNQTIKLILEGRNLLNTKDII